MILQLHTPKGIITKDTTTMTTQELTSLNLAHIPRLEQLLKLPTTTITPREHAELTSLIARHLGLTS